GTAQLDADFPQPAFYLRAFRPPGTVQDDLVIGRAQGGSLRVLGANAAGHLETHGDLTNVFVHALDVGPLLHANSQGSLDLVSVNHTDDVLEIRAATGDAQRFAT